MHKNMEDFFFLLLGWILDFKDKIYFLKKKFYFEK